MSTAELTLWDLLERRGNKTLIVRYRLHVDQRITKRGFFAFPTPINLTDIKTRARLELNPDKIVLQSWLVSELDMNEPIT